MSQGAEAVAADEPGSATAAKEHDRLSRNNFGTIRGFGYPKDQPVVWVKCSYNSEQLHSEALTQIYAHEHLVDLPEAQRNGVFVPRVYKTYYVTLDDIDWTYALIVMEYIRGVSVKQLLRETGNNKPRRELLISQVFDALNALLALEPDADTAPGPEGGGRIEHFIFDKDDSTTPQEFDSLQNL